MLYIFSIDEQLQAVLKNDGAACPYYDAYHTEELNENFQNVFIFTVPADHADSQHVTEGNLVAFKDLDLDWQLFEIKRVTDIHGDGLTRTAYCEHALYELIDDFIEDVRPTDCSAAFALTQALTGTRWSVGTVADLGLNSTNYYYQSALAAVQKVASVWSGELQFRVVVTGGVISNRYVDLLVRRGADTGKQWEYGRHTQEIEREVDLTTVITAAYGRGKGVEVGDGYGRRLDFGAIVWTTPTNPADKPLNQEWVGDPAALAQWGRAGGRHRFGTFEDSEETDAAALLQKTWDYLQANKTPRATYRMTVMDLERLSGYAHEKVRLGDTTRAIDRIVKPALLVSVRVIGLTRNILQPEDTKVTLGNFAPSLADEALAQRQINKVVSGAFSPTTGALATAWLDGIINILQNEIQNTAAYVWQTEADGILIMNAATFAEATKAMKIGGGTFALANSKTGAAWNWRTFGDGAGFTADELNAGTVLTNLVKIQGNTNFYWDGDYLYIVNPVNLNEQIRLSKEGIRFTQDGGTTWNVAIGFKGILMEGKPSDPRIWYSPTGQKTYNQNGELVTHHGYYELLAAQLAAFTRASTSYDDYGNLIASGVPRYPYMALPGPVWQDLFAVDLLEAEYTSGGDVAATWAVSGGVLTGTGGTHATLIKKDLLLQDCDIIINSDQAQDGGIIARWQDANNYYLLALSDDSGASPASNLTLYKRVGGTLTSLATADVTWVRATAKPIKFTLHGSLLEAYFDGAKVISITDTAFTGGAVGLRNNSATAFRVLDLSVYYAQLGVMPEEGTTNLLTANQASVETDTTGLVMTGTHGSKGTLSRITTDAWHGTACAQVVVSGFNVGDDVNLATAPEATAVTVTPSTPYAFIADGKAPVGVQWQLRVVEWNASGGAISSTTLKTQTGTGSSTADPWQLATGVLTTQATTAYVSVRLKMLGNGTFKFDGLGVAQKAYPLSWQLPGTARAAEVLTVPTAGVFTKSNWAVKLNYVPKTNDYAYKIDYLWMCLIDASNYYVLRINQTTGYIALYVMSGGVAKGIIGTTAVVVGNTYKITVTGDGSIMRLCVNGVQIGADTAYTEPIGTLPTNMYVGSDNSGVGQANGVISDFAVLNQPETLADHQAEFNTGLPLAVTDATTYLMSCDGTLQPTVRGFGLWSKNGRYILQDPQTGQGIELWDGATLKALIGRLSDGTIGVKVIGGKLYSTTIRSGAEGATTYTELGAGASDPLTVVVGGKTALNVWSGNDGGMLQIFNTTLDDMCGQISPTEAYYGTGGLRITGRNNAATHKTVAIVGSTIYLDPDDTGEVNLSGDLFVTGTLDVLGTPKNAVEVTSQGFVALAAVEAPEVLYIDRKGVAELINGECRIDLDPLFLECIIPNSEETPWNTLLTPKGPFTLYEAEIGDSYFVVKSHDPSVSGKFSWMLVSVRKNMAGIRLQRKWEENDLLISDWEDSLLLDDPLVIDETVLESNWEDDLI